jgi:hypothetical protein
MPAEELVAKPGLLIPRSTQEAMKDDAGLLRGEDANTRLRPYQMRAMSKGEFRLEVETVPQKYPFGASNCVPEAAKLPQNPRLRASDCAYEAAYDSQK